MALRLEVSLATATGTIVDAVVGEDLRAVVGSFHDDEPGMVATKYTAQIDWGDDSPPSTGEVFKERNGQWVVTGAHTYNVASSYPVTVTIVDNNHENGMTATVTSFVSVTDNA